MSQRSAIAVSSAAAVLILSLGLSSHFHSQPEVASSAKLALGLSVVCSSIVVLDVCLIFIRSSTVFGSPGLSNREVGIGTRDQSASSTPDVTEGVADQQPSGQERSQVDMANATPLVVSEGFIYDPLEDSQIRLLRVLDDADSGDDTLQVEIFHAHLNKRPAYTALSYTWGHAHGRSERILVNGQGFSASRNLADALRKLKEKGLLTVWADAICINQQDNREKSREILRVFAIYRMATTVVLWLGSNIGPEADVLELVSAIGESQTSGTGHSVSSLTKKAIASLERLLSQPYWSRVWIIQEVAATDRARILWGSYTFELSSVDALVRHCDTDLFGLAREVLSVRLASRAKRKPKLMEILAMTSASETTLSRDKVYGLLGLASDWSDFIIEPTYSENTSEKTLCLDMTFNHITWTSSVDIIFLRSTNRQKMELPSWCPDYFHFQLHEHDKNVFHYICGQNVNLGWERRRAFGDPENAPWVTPDTIRVAGTKLTLKGNLIGRISILSYTLNQGPVDSASDAFNIQNMDQNQGFNLPEAGKAFRRLLLLCHNQTFIRQDPSAFFSLLYALPEHVFRDNECMSVKRWLDVHKSFFEAFGLNVTVSSAADDDYGNNKNYAFIRSRNGGLSMSSTVILPEWKEYLNVNASVSSSNDGASNSMRRGKDSLQSILLSIASILRENQRLMFLGDESLLGWAHRDAEIGDTVWHLEGCTLQAILRRSAALSDESATGEDIYQLVGHAYVDSVMASGRWITKSKRRTVHLC